MLLSDPDTPDKEKEQQASGERGNYSNSLEKFSEKDSTKSHGTTATPWHSLGTEKIFEKLVTNSKGLDPEEAARRLHEYGKNILPARKPPGIVGDNSSSIQKSL